MNTNEFESVMPRIVYLTRRLLALHGLKPATGDLISRVYEAYLRVKDRLKEESSLQQKMTYIANNAVELFRYERKKVQRNKKHLAEIARREKRHLSHSDLSNVTLQSLNAALESLEFRHNGEIKQRSLIKAQRIISKTAGSKLQLVLKELKELL